MRVARSRRRATAAAVAAAAVVGLTVSATGTAQAAWHHPTAPRGHQQVVAPYFETWMGDSPAAVAQQAGLKDLTLAFLQTPATGSCTVDWNGDTSTPVSRSVFGSDIAKLQARGGEVIASFGGYSADDTATEIADSCTDVNKIAEQYEKVITTYHINRLDLDTEDKSLTNTGGIDRRNKAIAQVERWARRTHRHVEFAYTLPTTPNGLAPSGLAVLQNAKADHARVDVVNVMAFDYWDGATHDMAKDTETAAAGLHAQLAALHPHASSRALWRSIGVTEMIGIDDYGPQETFTLNDASTVERWAARQGINGLAFWAVHRDNGGCVGTKGASTCSGVAQNTWDFSHVFERLQQRHRHGWR